MVINFDAVVLKLQQGVDGFPLGVRCILVEDEKSLTMVRTGYSTVGAYHEPGDDMVVNAFYK